MQVNLACGKVCVEAVCHLCTNTIYCVFWSGNAQIVVDVAFNYSATDASLVLLISDIEDSELVK